MSAIKDNMKNSKVVKRYMNRGKMVCIIELNIKDKVKYCFKINDKCTGKDYYSCDWYDDKNICEKESYKVVKGI